MKKNIKKNLYGSDAACDDIYIDNPCFRCR